MKYKLLIFDMDDTLIASAKTWGRAEDRLFRQLGHARDQRIAEQYKGMNAWGVGRVIFENLRPSDMDAQQCGQLMRDFLLEEFRNGAQPMPGADALLRLLAPCCPLSVASGSPLQVIQAVLAQHHWSELFQLLITSEDVARGKPEPDVFLETARQFGCAPHEALVFEDSLNGVRAAKRAGMHCVVIPSSDDPRIRDEADRVFFSLAQVTPAIIAEDTNE